MYSRESSAPYKIRSCLSCWRVSLNLLNLLSNLTTCLASPTYCLRNFTQPHFPFFPLPLPFPLPQPGFGVNFGTFGSATPSISATFSNFLPNPHTSAKLPGLPGCLFPVINLLNCVIGHLNSMANPVCAFCALVIWAYKT